MTVQLDPEDYKEALRRAREALNAGDAARALDLLREIAAPSDDVSRQTRYARLAKEISGNMGQLPALRVAFLANATLDHWVDCLRFWLLLEGFRLQELLVPFGTWRQQLADDKSALYAFNPDVVWFFLQAEDLHFESDLSPDAAHSQQFIEKATADIVSQVATVASKLPALCLVNNIAPPADRIFGNLEGSNAESSAARIQRFNMALGQALPAGAAVFDIAHLAARFGLDRWEDARLWHHSKHPFALDAQGQVAFVGARILAAARGRAHKCLIVDLDNTLWGGVVGDDGLEGIRIGPDGGAAGEAFARFQRWLKALSVRGIALAVCSKNNPDLAREPFLRKQGMVLNLADFVSFKANWDNKADNIRAIAQELNLGLDSFVFVDDNPAERALVRRELPQIGVPEMPQDPSEYVATLAAGAWFETLAVTNEDLTRVRSYRENMGRQLAQSAATDLDTYLCSLEMKSRWAPVAPETSQRAAQLVNKTNQFHPTGTRYTHAQIVALAASSDAWVGQFSLADRFGDHGITAVVVLRFEDTVAVIDTWVMSCRVFSRRMEDFTFGVIWNIARDHGCQTLQGLYVPTPKNAVVAGLFGGFGGIQGEPGAAVLTWHFDLTGPPPVGTAYIADMSQHETHA